MHWCRCHLVVCNNGVLLYDYIVYVICECVSKCVCSIYVYMNVFIFKCVGTYACMCAVHSCKLSMNKRCLEAPPYIAPFHPCKHISYMPMLVWVNIVKKKNKQPKCLIGKNYCYFCLIHHDNYLFGV